MQIQYAVHGEISYLRVMNRVQRRVLPGNDQSGSNNLSFFLPGSKACSPLTRLGVFYATADHQSLFCPSKKEDMADDLCNSQMANARFPL